MAIIDKGRIQLDESAESLQERFRSVEVVLEHEATLPAGRSRTTGSTSSTAGRSVRYVDTSFDQDGQLETDPRPLSDRPAPRGPADEPARDLRGAGPHLPSVVRTRTPIGMSLALHQLRHEFRRSRVFVAVYLVILLGHFAVAAGWIGQPEYNERYNGWGNENVLPGFIVMAFWIALTLVVMGVTTADSPSNKDRLLATRPLSRSAPR